MDAAIEVTGLTHSFDGRRALDDVSLTVRRGEIFGVLGPNGAGKTTTVRVLNGLYRPQAGRMRVWGRDPVAEGTEVRRHTGVLTEAPSLNELLTVEENLAFYGTLYGVPAERLGDRITRTLDELDLSDRRHEKAGTLSKGLKQRLAIARALLHEPPVLFLDEPTSGLDPESAEHVNALILRLKQEGRTVFLCTHRLAEAERVCDRFAFYSRGRVIAAGTREELEARVDSHLRVTLEFLAPPGALPRADGAEWLQGEGAQATWKVRDRDAIARLVERASAEGAAPWRVEPHRPSLEELYFTLQRQDAEGQA